MPAEEVTWICPRCNNTVPSCIDPLTCSEGHLPYNMVPVREILPGTVQVGGKRSPAGPLKYAAFTAFICVFASILAWIWLGEWEWGPTAAVLLFAGIFLREGSLREKAPPTIEDWLSSN
jgi:hypothetical protein